MCHSLFAEVTVLGQDLCRLLWAMEGSGETDDIAKADSGDNERAQLIVTSYNVHASEIITHTVSCGNISDRLKAFTCGVVSSSCWTITSLASFGKELSSPFTATQVIGVSTLFFSALPL